MAESELKKFLYGQLALFAVYLVKELLKILKDQGKKNSEDIGALKIKDAKREADLNAAWEAIRELKKDRDR